MAESHTTLQDFDHSQKTNQIAPFSSIPACHIIKVNIVHLYSIIKLLLLINACFILRYTQFVQVQGLRESQCIVFAHQKPMSQERTRTQIRKSNAKITNQQSKDNTSLRHIQNKFTLAKFSTRVQVTQASVILDNSNLALIKSCLLFQCPLCFNKGLRSVYIHSVKTLNPSFCIK